MGKQRLSYKELHRIVKGEKQKRCPKCKEYKLESEFHRSRARKDGLQCHCKTCRNIRLKKWQKKKQRFI